MIEPTTRLIPAAARVAVALALLLLVSAAAPAQAPAPSPVVAIRAGRLVDVEKGTALADQVVIVENGLVKAVGGAREVAIPAGATVVDLSGATVLPGLFDCHSHLCLTTQPDNRDIYLNDVLQTSAYRAIQGVANARAMLESGFTTVRDVGNSGNYVDADLRRAIERGIVPGPTVVNAGRIIAPYGGQYNLQPERRELGAPEYIAADTRDEIRKAVRENAHFGARVIKIVVDDQRYIYSADDIRFVVSEAAAAGLRVAAHCLTDAGARNAAEARVASIEHGLVMSDATLELCKRNGVVLVGTDFTAEAAGHLGLPPDEAKQFHDLFLERLKRAHKVGVTMAFGTDAFFAVPGETRGTLAISYVDTYVEAGIPAADVLRMMTVNAARLLGVEARRGAIRPGMAADIIATAANPLDDVRALEKVVFVMKDGAVFKNDWNRAR